MTRAGSSHCDGHEVLTAGHQVPGKRRSLTESRCRERQGYRSPNGYGTFRDGYQVQYAHRSSEVSARGSTRAVVRAPMYG